MLNIQDTWGKETCTWIRQTCGFYRFKHPWKALYFKVYWVKEWMVDMQMNWWLCKQLGKLLDHVLSSGFASSILSVSSEHLQRYFAWDCFPSGPWYPGEHQPWFCLTVSAAGCWHLHTWNAGCLRHRPSLPFSPTSAQLASGLASPSQQRQLLIGFPSGFLNQCCSLSYGLVTPLWGTEVKLVKGEE